MGRIPDLKPPCEGHARCMINLYYSDIPTTHSVNQINIESLLLLYIVILLVGAFNHIQMLLFPP